MIDHILINKRFQFSINLDQTRTFPEADIGSDHDLLMTSVRLRLKKIKKGELPRIKFDLGKLKDMAEAFPGHNEKEICATSDSPRCHRQLKQPAERAVCR